jgi:hypothetical protein
MVRYAIDVLKAIDNEQVCAEGLSHCFHSCVECDTIPSGAQFGWTSIARLSSKCKHYNHSTGVQPWACSKP